MTSEIFILDSGMKKGTKIPYRKLVDQTIWRPFLSTIPKFKVSWVIMKDYNLVEEL